MSSAERDAETTAPFLATGPPIAVARSLSSLCLLLSAASLVASVAVQVPETVGASFVLTPRRGADPVRALRSGSIGEVHVEETQTVAMGDPMFTVVSTLHGDRAAEWKSLEVQIRGAEDRLSNQRAQEASLEQADATEAGRLAARRASLDRAIAMRRQQLGRAAEGMRRQRDAHQRGLVPWTEMTRSESEAESVALELEAAEAERVDVERSLVRLRHDAAARRAGSIAADRMVIEELERSRIRRAALDEERLDHGSRFVARAPCAGVVVKLLVRSRGAVVQDGEALAEVSCGERLHAELKVAQSGAARIQPGQRVKLLYRTFPYQRFGAQPATIRWISPVTDAAELRVFADLDRESIAVEGRPRALNAGMEGQARIVVGRRTLASFAIQPIRQLRENLRDIDDR